uniref:Uncharacterized protein n=1 Tax=Arundo donax TaxID=35708 RepID=A0A0A9FHM1_ARUDO
MNASNRIHRIGRTGGESSFAVWAVSITHPARKYLLSQVLWLISGAIDQCHALTSQP